MIWQLPDIQRGIRELALWFHPNSDKNTTNKTKLQQQKLPNKALTPQM